jgi:hypothetical protein
LDLNLPKLLAHTLLCLGQGVPFALEFLAADDFGQIDIEQAGVLPLDLCERLAQGMLACLERLRKPLAALGTLEFVDDEGRVGKHLTEILPDQRIERLGPDIAGNAALSQGCPQRVGAPPTPIITIPGLTGPPRTG